MQQLQSTFALQTTKVQAAGARGGEEPERVLGRIGTVKLR